MKSDTRLFPKGTSVLSISDKTSLITNVPRYCMLHLMGVDRRRMLSKITQARALQFDDAQSVDLETRARR